MIFLCIFIVTLATLAYLHREKLSKKYRLYQERRQLLAWANSPPMKNAATIIDELYKNVNGMAISLNVRNAMTSPDDSLLYGEAVLYSFADLLALTEPKINEVFYDLGSGVGKPVFMAALLYDFSKAVGIELLEPLHREAMKCLKYFNASPLRERLYPQKNFNIHFVQSHILQADFSDATILFLNGSAFFGILWQRIIEKLKTLPVGARLIVTTKCLDESYFKLEHHGGHLMSWGLAAVSVYKKIR